VNSESATVQNTMQNTDNHQETTQMISNPILPGFNPDPSILRVGEDFYIATSTFEWFPGVQIHHSRDLVNWRLLTRPLDRKSQLDLKGDSDSGGIWAPCLTHDGTQFYLIYTDVKGWAMGEMFKDTHNYLVTAPNIEGPWSEPIYLNSSGFDPSLFHDLDGRKWFINMRWDHRAGKNPFSGIVLQEVDTETYKLKGSIHNIFTGTELGVTEGAHLYQKDGWYYLLTAEGGTSYQHAITLARSKSLLGPYEIHPTNPLLTSHGHPEVLLQKAGHGSLVQTQTDEWYLVHLCGRPLVPGVLDHGFCNLGRETGIQRLEWPDGGWPMVSGGGNQPLAHVVAPQLPLHPWPATPARDDFDAPELAIDWQSLRVPVDSSWLSLTERPGFLRLVGRESPISRHNQSMLARRLQAFYAEASTCLEFDPQDSQQMAGITAYYDTRHWSYLRVSRDEVLGKTLNILVVDQGQYSEPLQQEVCIEGWDKVYLKVKFERATYQYGYSQDGQNWTWLEPQFESYKLSDDYCGGLAFTGAFIGLCAQDLAGSRLHADFDYFEYLEQHSENQHEGVGE
jgi:xylan 1,4-beta-xylosidase